MVSSVWSRGQRLGGNHMLSYLTGCRLGFPQVGLAGLFEEKEMNRKSVRKDVSVGSETLATRERETK